ncbi:MAG: putative ATP-dependent RNA helicase [Methanoregulaceae archaeon PtaU1.Bin059]|nr:MAG: putative ATP-dependent RNA helicase [Methanoregulaceae archaeon PtaB.Bin152]OPY40100.1 MAG: putative ATP-dependent RNA helicase [Methanoregulaceae archaeon PtaU1.Bin059]
MYMKTISFVDLDLPEPLMRAVLDMGFEEPTPIQSLAIPVMREHHDMVGQAHTGTGKTAAFGIPLLEHIDASRQEVQAVVLCPTRELAIQVSEELRRLAKYLRGITILPVYGGQPIERQIAVLKKGVQIIIATPGRLIDHLDRRTISLSGIRLAVLDEADEMLDMGFREDIELILKRTPAERQTVLFSATMSKEILSLTQKYLKSPRMVKVVHGRLEVPALIEQRYFEVRESDKVEVLSRLIDFYNPKLSLVFCNTKRKVDEVCTQLQARGYLAEALHGDMDQKERERVMSRFRAATSDILVATDVAARGIDVEEVGVVFNYDVPQDPEYYIHRIGRTGRAGKSGKAFTFVSGKEMWKLRDIQKFAKIRIARHAVPAEEDLRERRIVNMMERIREQIATGNLEPYIARVEQVMGDEYTSLEVAAALFRMQAGMLPGSSAKGRGR